jgi:hypothetical protein
MAEAAIILTQMAASTSHAYLHAHPANCGICQRNVQIDVSAFASKLSKHDITKLIEDIIGCSFVALCDDCMIEYLDSNNACMKCIKYHTSSRKGATHNVIKLCGDCDNYMRKYIRDCLCCGFVCVSSNELGFCSTCYNLHIKMEEYAFLQDESMED